MPRYALTIAYDGTDFCGWQRQEPVVVPGQPLPTHVPAQYILGPPRVKDEEIHPPLAYGVVELRTVQAILQRAVREVVREPVEVIGSSRTDSGVHARGQVAAFSTTSDCEHGRKGRGWPADRGLDRLIRAINDRLPPDVVVVGARVVPDRFDPVFDTQSKGYTYMVHGGRSRPLFDRRFLLHVRDGLDVRAMQEAAGHLVGEHDFAAFSAISHARITSVRHVLRCDVVDCGFSPHPGPPWRMDEVRGGILDDAQRVRIEISSKGFLYNMVRIIAGTLVDVGLGRMPASQVLKALQTGNRRDAGPTLSAVGLCLDWIKYRDESLTLPVDTAAPTISA